MMTDSKCVLIVDDEADIREGVRYWLHASGFDTSVAEDGAVGFDAAKRNPPHAILLDVLMPNLGGMETLAQLRANPITSHIPVVMLSASLRDEQRALDAGARYFLHKPYDGKELLSAVRTAIGDRQAYA